MPTPLNIVDITVIPSAVDSGVAGKNLFAWKMKLHQESTLDSEDHGDDFDTSEEALAHAFAVFENLVSVRQLYPANAVQCRSLRSPFTNPSTTTLAAGHRQC